MTYSDLVKKVKKAFQSTDASSVNEHVAIQFNVYGEGEGALYLEIADGKVDVQPYEYYDRDAVVISTAEELVDIATGKLDIIEANNMAKIQVEGSVDKVSILSKIVTKPKKTATKKAEKTEKPVKEVKKTEKAEKVEKPAKEVKKVEKAEKVEKPAKEAKKAEKPVKEVKKAEKSVKTASKTTK